MMEMVASGGNCLSPEEKKEKRATLDDHGAHMVRELTEREDTSSHRELLLNHLSNIDTKATWMRLETAQRKKRQNT